MNAQTTFSGTPDELKAMLTQVIEPLVERIANLEDQLGEALQAAAGNAKLAYTVTEAAQQIGFKVCTIRTCIHKGQLGRNGRIVKLKAKEVTKGHYRILPADLKEFLNNF